MITQLYFEGDQYNKTDPYASKPEAKSRTIPVKANPATGVLSGVFSLVLPDLPVSEQKTSVVSAPGYDLLIERRKGRVRFIVPQDHINCGFLGVYSTAGLLIREWPIAENSIEWSTEKVSTGTYVARLFLQGETEETVHIRV